ncbi:hypothetical protein [Candidatus Bandiella numerosa]|uniref:hypothetical protein n=1 Tax=Candidatus Bandiella numerosa TaxID=2570586 RepID=UPI001F1E04CB|nr:hypothetical protein [Candidatus Bandiella numerosa]
MVSSIVNCKKYKDSKAFVPKDYSLKSVKATDKLLQNIVDSMFVIKSTDSNVVLNEDCLSLSSVLVKLLDFDEIKNVDAPSFFNISYNLCRLSEVISERDYYSFCVNLTKSDKTKDLLLGFSALINAEGDKYCNLKYDVFKKNDAQFAKLYTLCGDFYFFSTLLDDADNWYQRSYSINGNSYSASQLGVIHIAKAKTEEDVLKGCKYLQYGSSYSELTKARYLLYTYNSICFDEKIFTSILKDLGDETPVALCVNYHLIHQNIVIDDSFFSFDKMLSFFEKDSCIKHYYLYHNILYGIDLGIERITLSSALDEIFDVYLSSRLLYAKVIINDINSNIKDKLNFESDRSLGQSSYIGPKKDIKESYEKVLQKKYIVNNAELNKLLPKDTANLKDVSAFTRKYLTLYHPDKLKDYQSKIDDIEKEQFSKEDIYVINSYNNALKKDQVKTVIECGWFYCSEVVKFTEDRSFLSIDYFYKRNEELFSKLTNITSLNFDNSIEYSPYSIMQYKEYSCKFLKELLKIVINFKKSFPLEAREISTVSDKYFESINVAFSTSINGRECYNSIGYDLIDLAFEQKNLALIRQYFDHFSQYSANLKGCEQKFHYSLDSVLNGVSRNEEVTYSNCPRFEYIARLYNGNTAIDGLEVELDLYLSCEYYNQSQLDKSDIKEEIGYEQWLICEPYFTEDL